MTATFIMMKEMFYAVSQKNTSSELKLNLFIDRLFFLQKSVSYYLPYSSSKQ